MFADDCVRGVAQGFEIDEPAAVVNVGREKGRAELTAEDAVFVGLGHGAMRAWKASGTICASSTRMAAGRVRFRGALEVFRRDGCAEFKAGDLSEGVDAGIGAAGALRQRRLAPGMR